MKRHLTPLDQVELLDDEALEALRSVSIGTVEEFVGALEADPDSMRDLLHLNDAELEDLKDKAYGLIDPSLREAIQDQRGREYPLFGALDPSPRETQPD